MTPSDEYVKSAKGSFSFMVRYPFDLLTAVSKVEPLTMNVSSNTYNRSKAFALRYRRVNATSYEIINSAFHNNGHARGVPKSTKNSILTSCFSIVKFARDCGQLHSIPAKSTTTERGSAR